MECLHITETTGEDQDPGGNKRGWGGQKGLRREGAGPAGASGMSKTQVAGTEQMPSTAGKSMDI